jgi:hypothetical protein
MLVFFSLDYIHLYFFMDNKFSEQEKDSWFYVISDFLVAGLMFIAFKYCEDNNHTVIWCISLVPFCYFVYSLKLKYNRWFYGVYFLVSLALAFLINRRIEAKPVGDYRVLFFILGMAVTYLIYIILNPNKIERK